MSLRYLVIWLFALTLGGCTQAPEIPTPNEHGVHKLVTAKLRLHREALGRNVDDATLWSAYGSVLAANGFRQEARQAYSQSLAMVPDNDVLFLLAYSFRDEPATAYQLAVDLPLEESAEYKEFVAGQLRLLGRVEESLGLYTDLADSAPETVDFQSDGLEVALEVGDQARASRFLGRLLKMAPEDEVTQYLQTQFQRMFAVEVDADETVAGPPRYFVNAVVRDMEENSRSETGLRALGRRAVLEGDWPAVVEWYEVLAAGYELNAKDRFNLGVGLTTQRRYKEALANLTQAHEEEANNPDVLLAIARVHLVLGDNEKAEQEYRKVLTLPDADRFLATQGVGRAKAGQGDMDGAMTWLTDASRLAGATPDVFEDLARVATDQGRYEAAKQYVGMAEARGFKVDPRLTRFLGSI